MDAIKMTITHMVFVKGKNTSSEVVLDADIFILKSKREI
jgi:hypothetical protein